MRTFATYEEENIHYWTHRASGYSAVNQEELATDQKAVWRGRAFLPSFWRSWAIR